MMMKWWTAMALVAMLPGVPPSSAQASVVCSDPLQCYLSNVVINIPDECVDVSGTQLCIANAQVFGLTLSSIDSSYEKQLAPTTLNVGMVNAGAQMAGDYTYGRLIKGSVKGTLSMTLKLGIFVATDGSWYPLPLSANFSTCSFPQLSLVLSFGNAILDGAAKLMESKIEASIVKAVCVTLNMDIANQTATQFGAKLDPSLLNIIANLPSVPAVYGSEYINWADSLVGKLHAAVEKFRQSDAMSCLEKRFPDLLIPAFPSFLDKVVDLITNSTGSVTVPLSGISVDLSVANATLALTAVTLSGLDSWVEIAPFNIVPSSNVSLTSRARLESLNITLHLTLAGGAAGYSETLSATVAAKNVMLMTEMLLLVYKADISTLYLDQLLPRSTHSRPAKCLLGAIQSASFSSIVLQLNMSEIVVSQVTSAGALEADVVLLVDNSLQMVLGGFPSLIISLLAGIVQGPVRRALNVGISNLVGGDVSCPEHTPSNTELLVEWPKSAALAKIDHIINDVMGSDKLNAVIKCIANGSFDTNFGPLHLHVDGLDSFSTLKLLQPIDTFALRNEIALASVNPLVVTLSAAQKGKMASLRLQNLSVAMDLMVQIDKYGVTDLQWGQLSCPGCLASTVTRLALLPGMNASVSKATLSSSSSSSSTSTTAEVKSVTKASNALLSVATSDKVTRQINSNLASYLAASGKLCANGGVAPDSGGGAPASETGAGAASWSLMTTLTVLLSVVCCSGLLAAAWRRRGFQKRSDDQKTKKVEVPDGRSFFAGSLLFDVKLPFALRVVVPLLLVGNIVLFAISNSLADAVTVQVTARIASHTTESFNAFGFSFAGTVSDMWEARTYALAALIAFFSGGWPYLKLLYLLFAWVAPHRQLSVQRRYAGLKFVDLWGKFSLLDFYVMALFMVAFHLKMQIAGFGEVVVTVAPHPGFYSFLGATIASLLLGHCVLAAHRHVVHVEAAAAADDGTPPSSDRESLYSHQYSLGPANGGGKGRITTIGYRTVAVLLVVTAVFLAAATCVHTFRFTFIGLTGLLLGDAATTTFSYVSVGQMLPMASGMPDEWQMTLMQIAYFCFGVVLPAGLVLALTVLFFLPLSLARQRQGLVIVECLFSWAALDVFLLSVFAALLQIQQFAAFIVGDSCDGINAFLALHMDALLDGQDVCFDLVASLLPETCWILLLAALLLSFVSFSGIAMLEKAIKDREEGVVVVLAGEDADGDLTYPLLPEPEHTVSSSTTSTPFSIRLLLRYGLFEEVRPFEFCSFCSGK